MAKTSNTNYLRLYLLNNDVGASALREVFTKRVQESFAKGNVIVFLQYFKTNIDVLNNKRIISIAAYKQLFPTKSSDVDINQWDVSLLSTILLHCCCLDETLETLKKVLTEEVEDVDSYLDERKATIEKLKDASKLTGEQYEILFPSFPFTDLNIWDGNLLLCILLNLCKQQTVQKVCNILRDVIKQSVVLSVGHPDVKAFLKKVKVKIEGMRNKCVITSAQFEMLFPENGEQTDVYKWDNELLCIVVLQVCCQLPEEIVDAIKTVRRFRNKILAHRGNAEIDDKQFQDKWKLLKNAIRKLLKGTEYKMNEDIEKKIKQFYDRPLAIEPTITDLKKQYSRDQEILLVLEKVQKDAETAHIETNAAFKEIQDEIQLIRRNQHHEHVRQLYVFKIMITVSANTKEAADEAELILKEYFENPTKHRADRYDSAGEAVQSVTIGLQDHGAVIQGISTGSVILDLQCDSLAGLNKFIQYYAGEQLQHSLNKVQRVLQREFSCDLQIAMRIPDDDLRKLLLATVNQRELYCKQEKDEVYQRELYCKQEKDEDGFRRSMKIHLASSSLDGMCEVLEMFNSGDISNKFDNITDALSERLGQPVSITPSLDCGAFKDAIQSAARQPDLPGASRTGHSTTSSTSREDEQFPVTTGSTPKEPKQIRSLKRSSLSETQKDKQRQKRPASASDIGISSGSFEKDEGVDTQTTTTTITWSAETRDKLFQEITKLKPLSIERTKVPMIGQVGAGKSSFINTIASVFRRLAPAGTSAGYRAYPVFSGLETDYAFIDAGFEYLLDGNVQSGHHFDPTTAMTPDTPGFTRDPPYASKVHCVCFVVDATTVTAIKDALLERFRQFLQRLRARDGTPYVVILTKIDLLDPDVRADTSKVYQSIKVRNVIDNVADILSIPKSRIVPLKNYEYELELDMKVDILALLALRLILRASEAFVSKY